jgi:hypothetical protein
MKLLGEVATATMIRIDEIENEARRMVSELDSLDSRLHRAFTALCIDSYVSYLNVQRKRMLEDEKQAETNADLTRLPALGIYGLLSLFSRQKPNWKRAVGSVLKEEPFGDIRVAASNDDMKLMNVSGIARGRGMTVAEVVAYLMKEGYKVFSWTEFEAEAENLRMAALKGETEHLGIEEAGLEDIQALTTGPGGGGIVVS